MSTDVGGPEHLRLMEQESPLPKVGEVVLAVQAAGINFPDSLIIRDQYQVRPPRPFAPGGEVSGIVSAVGDGVDTLKVGDRVIARPGWGGLAEKVAVRAAVCFKMPDHMPFDEGAVFLFTYTTAYHALQQRARLAPGETLLVLGAAGGTGTAAVEIGKAMGGRVVAAASTEAKVALAQDCGADIGIVYPRGPLGVDAARSLAAEFKAIVGQAGANVIFDPVGGDLTEAALRSIAWGGRHLVVGFTAGIPRLPLNLALLKGCDIVGVFNGHFQATQAELAAQNSRQLLQLYEDKKLRPRIEKRVPFADAPSAIRAISAGEVMGKLVVTMDVSA